MIDFRRMFFDLAGLATLAGLAFVAVSLLTFDPLDPPSTTSFPARELISNAAGPAGAVAAYRLFEMFGWGAWWLLANMAVFAVQLFSRGRPRERVLRIFSVGLTLFAVCSGLSLTIPWPADLTPYGSGGWFGAACGLMLQREFSSLGTAILLLSVGSAGLLLTGDAWQATRWLRRAATPLRRVVRLLPSPKPLLTACGAMVPRFWKRPVRPEIADEGHNQTPSLVPHPASLEGAKAGEALSDPLPSPGPCGAEAAREIRINPPASTARPAPPVLLSQQVPLDLPGLELLEDAEEFPYDELAEKARVAAETLERTFQEFGLNVTVSEIDTGPVVTQFELNLEKGLRVSKVAALADDLAIALRVPAVRIVSPIPGKNTVGVEVPNDTQVMVRLRELIEATPEDTGKHRIPLYLGKDVSGRPLVVDMTKMPHLLIAGRTGTGKSVCINTLILSILFTRRPEDVKMLMIDPKMVELSPYKRLPHLMHPVITDMKKAEAVLAWAVDKMEQRYDLLARVGVRHLDSYNKLSRAERLARMGLSELDEEAKDLPEKMPYIVIIADEMADMMMTSGKDVEGHIIRLAQKSRAVGIHLVLATQKPTVDVITGLIKSNLPARISFQVASRTDSRVVLDEMGAERLLGAGDMLYLQPGTSNLIRAQGTYVSSEETESVIEFFGDVEPQYSEELQSVTASGAAGPANADEIRKKDELYEQAIDIVVNEGRGSTSLLQRAMGIGYGRAARLIDFMAEDGIVGEYNGSQAREVLYTAEQWEAIKAGAEPVGV